MSIPPPGRTYVRWTICALLFAATTLNYIDRGVFGILGKELGSEFHWSEIDYSTIVMAFQAAYALGLLLAGRLLDRIGLRLGYVLAVAVWSLAAMGHALAGSIAGFVAARFLLGLGEAGNFPAAIKAVAQWFPARERALATGIFNSGANVGAIATPLLVPWIALTWGWQAAFIATGALGVLWLPWWWWWYRRPSAHPRASQAERELVSEGRAEEDAAAIGWDEALRHRPGWAFVIGKFLTDPVWWFYLYWFPKFLGSMGVDLHGLPLPLVIVYVVSDLGSIAGGWLSSHLIARGWSVGAARKTAMLVCVLCIVPVAEAPATGSVAWSVALVALAAAGHQGWSANLFTLVSDAFPQRAVGTVVGVGGTAGAIGGMLMAAIVGHVLEWTGSYLPLFIIGAGVYVLALLAIHRLLPRLDLVEVRSRR